MTHSQRSIIKSSFHVLEHQCRTLCKMRPPGDMIGPPDPISNLRHIKYAVRENETPAEKDLRKYREELQDWNKMFWTKHNLSFIQKRKEFEMNKKGSDNEALNADEMSVFYKEFLDKNWRIHLRYLLEWYQRNIFVTFLHFKVTIEKILRKSS